MIENLATQLVQLLTNTKTHIVTMESCTGGGLANYITNIPGSSDVLMDSFITYSNAAKIKLGVPAELIQKYTVYSPEVALSMAEQAIMNSVAPKHNIIGVGITGNIPAKSNQGTTYIGIVYKDLKFNHNITLTGYNRKDNKNKILYLTLNNLIFDIGF